jgi:hypothetical protein
MKSLTLGELVYLRNLYEADLKSESENNYVHTLDKIQSIIDEANALNFTDDILFSYRTRKQIPTYKVKKKRRYILQLTQGEIDNICGSLNTRREDLYEYDRPRWNKLTKLCEKVCNVRENGMKSV